MTQAQQNTIWQRLPALPDPFNLAQCVSFPQTKELLICGGQYNRNCYSFHLQKQEYKLICEYPDDIKLAGHIVIPYPSSRDDNQNFNQDASPTINLLSFGGNEYIAYHTLVIKYKSVWNDQEKDNEESEKE